MPGALVRARTGLHEGYDPTAGGLENVMDELEPASPHAATMAPGSSGIAAVVGGAPRKLTATAAPTAAATVSAAPACAGHRYAQLTEHRDGPNGAASPVQSDVDGRYAGGAVAVAGTRGVVDGRQEQEQEQEQAEFAESAQRLPEWPVPVRAPGVDLLGEYTGSGFSQPQYLVRRHDGQVVQLSRLLYLVVAETDGVAAAGEIAGRVSDAYGRPVSAANVEFLLTDRLQPLGLVLPGTGHGESASAAPAPRANPILGLRARRVLVPYRVVRPIAGLLAPVFHPLVVAAVLVGLVVFDVWLFSGHRIAAAGHAVVAHPILILATIAVTVLSALFHEFGHAAGCRYGGGRPGAIGVGLYLVWPSFYTNVTDAYRLNRTGRLRTDLGGFYFNGIYILAVGGIYAGTGFQPLPLVVLLVHVEILQQLLPLVRVDGYFILADLVGVPDLFSRVRPILASLRPRRKAHPLVSDLKRRVRVIITAWLLVTIPLLIGSLLFFLVHLPNILTTTGRALRQQLHLTTAAAGGGDVAAAAVGAVSMLLLLLPLAGMAWVLTSLGRRSIAGSVAVSRRHPLRGVAIFSGLALALTGLALDWTLR